MFEQDSKYTGVSRPPGLQGAYQCEGDEPWEEPGQHVSVYIHAPTQ
jgi:hypothetical protein